MNAIRWVAISLIATVALIVGFCARSQPATNNLCGGPYWPPCPSANSSDNVYVGPYHGLSSVPKNQSLCFHGADGKQGCVNFGGEKVTYTGDLEFDAAARQLFEALHVGNCR